MIKKVLVLAGLCICLLVLPTGVQADTIFSNLGPFVSGGFPPTANPGYNASDGVCGANGFGSCGVEFTSPGDFALTQVVTPIAEGAGHPSPDPLFLSVRLNANGQPGATLETFLVFTETLFGGPAVQPEVVTSALEPLLLAGNQYWLVLSSTDPNQNALAVWYANSTGGIGPLEFNGAGAGSGIQPAFEVDGTPVPEPGSLLLLGTGAAGLAIVFRRYRRKTASSRNHKRL